MIPVRAANDAAGSVEAEIYGPLISQLPRLQPGRLAGQFSSHDRSGGNRDWSEEQAGRPGYLYRDRYGHRVLAEVKGEGALPRLWFTGIDRVGNIRIYIDNDSTPTYDLPVRELFAGTHPPFLRPWVFDDTLSSGGFVSYVRIPFQRSFKLTTTGEPSYYHVGYEIVMPDSTAAPAAADKLAPRAATETATSPSAGSGVKAETTTGELVIPPGQAASLPALTGPAVLTRLVLILPDVSIVPPDTGRRVHDDGRAFTGYSEFTVEIEPENQGVRLIRRLDYGIGDQTALVYVDGEQAGWWSTPGSDTAYNWREAAFDIPAEYTRGKSSLRIRIQFVSSRIDWNEFYYWVYTRPVREASSNAVWATAAPATEAGQPVIQDEQGATLILTDSLDVGNASSEAAHRYQIAGQKWQGDRDFQYPPVVDKEEEARRTASLEILSRVWLEASWDDQPVAVQAPLSLFFATPVGPHPVDSALIQAAATGAGAQLTSRWPMPFARRAELRLKNEGSRPARVLFAVTSEAAPGLPGEIAQARVGYFHATYRRENPTASGQDYTILEVDGLGKLVGVSMRLAGPTSRWYLEGDERIRVDGSSTPIIYGTGTEDHFGGGWYFNRGPFSLPFHGAPGHTVSGGQDVTGVYRWFVTDPVTFRNGIAYSIEHGGQNETTCDYESVAFWYGVAASALVLTDEFRPADTTDQSIHGWQATGTAERKLLVSSYEGPLDRYNFQDAGLYQSGRSKFVLSLDPANRGVVLRRRLDQGAGAQIATVKIDGRPAGVWANLEKNTDHRFADSDFLLPASLTQGRSRVEIEIEPVGIWTSFLYQAYCLVEPSPGPAHPPVPGEESDER